MKRISLGAVYEGGLLAVLLLVVVHAPLTIWLGTIWPDYSLAVKAWKEVLLALLAIVAIVLISRRKVWTKLLHSPAILLSLLLIDVHLLMAVLLFDTATATVAGLMIDLRFIVMFMLTYVLVLLRPQAFRRLLQAAAAGAAVVLGFGLLQITVLPDDVLSGLGYSKETITPYITIDRNPDFVRINSTLRGPNPLGALAVVYMTLVLAWVARRYATASVRRRVVAVATGLASVAVLFASYSRSAYLAAVVGVGTVLVAARRPTKRVLLIAGGSAVAVVAGLLMVSSSDWFSNVVLHEDPESTVEAKSNSDHAASLLTGAERLLRQPFGAGIGSTGSATLRDDTTDNDFIVENYYFFVAHESGWIGLITFVALFVVVLRQLYQRRAGWPALGLLGSGIGLGLIGLLLPVWTDDTVALIWWGLAGAAIAPLAGIMKGGHAKRTRKQTPTRTA